MWRHLGRHLGRLLLLCLLVSSRRMPMTALVNLTEQNAAFLRGIQIAEEAALVRKISPQTLKTIRRTIYKFKAR